MRSDLVFTAKNKVTNQYLLCHLIRLRTRSFQKSIGNIDATINQALVICGEQDLISPPAVVANKTTEGFVFHGAEALEGAA